MHVTSRDSRDNRDPWDKRDALADPSFMESWLLANQLANRADQFKKMGQEPNFISWPNALPRTIIITTQITRITRGRNSEKPSTCTRVGRFRTFLTYLRGVRELAPIASTCSFYIRFPMLDELNVGRRILRCGSSYLVNTKHSSGHGRNSSWE